MLDREMHSYWCIQC